MHWRVIGVIAAVLFVGLAVLATGAPNAALSVVVLLAAAGTGIALSRGGHVARWVGVILVVFPAELALMSLVFEDPALRQGMSMTEVLVRPAALESAALLLVAAWAATLVFVRPHRNADTPDF